MTVSYLCYKYVMIVVLETQLRKKMTFIVEFDFKLR